MKISTRYFNFRWFLTVPIKYKQFPKANQNKKNGNSAILCYRTTSFIQLSLRQTAHLRIILLFFLISDFDQIPVVFALTAIQINGVDLYVKHKPQLTAIFPDLVCSWQYSPPYPWRRPSAGYSWGSASWGRRRGFGWEPPRFGSGWRPRCRCYGAPGPPLCRSRGWRRPPHPPRQMQRGN